MIENIIWLSKNSEELEENEIFEWLTTICTPEQVGIIMNHIKLLEDNMLIGYDKKDVYVMFVNEDEDGDNEIIKISKNS